MKSATTVSLLVIARHRLDQGRLGVGGALSRCWGPTWTQQSVKGDREVYLNCLCGIYSTSSSIIMACGNQIWRQTTSRMHSESSPLYLKKIRSLNPIPARLLGLPQRLFLGLGLAAYLTVHSTLGTHKPNRQYIQSMCHRTNRASSLRTVWPSYL